MPLDYESFDESENVGHIRVGGGSKKHTSKSQETASSEFVQRLQLERQKSSQEKIEKYIEETWNDPKDPKRDIYIAKFSGWMEKASHQKNLKLDPNDVFMKAQTGGGPGGQNVNKVATTVMAKHGPTQEQIFAHEFRTQIANKEEAGNLLTAKVKSLLEVWKQTSLEFRVKLLPEQKEG